MLKKCPKCGSLQDRKFCTQCGQDLSGDSIVKICPVCGAESTRKFCIHCGTKLDQESVDDIQDSKEDEVSTEEYELINQPDQQKEEDNKEEIKQALANRKKYEEALSYMDYAEKENEKTVAVEFFRKAESLFDEILGWEDSEEKSLVCSRKAKACEIAINREAIIDKQTQENKNVHQDVNSNVEQEENTRDGKEDKPVSEKKVSASNSKSKLIIALVIAAILIIGVVIAVTTHDNTNDEQTNNTEKTAETTDYSNTGEEYQGEVIAIEDGTEIKWDTGSAVLTGYQFENSAFEGDCVNLYFEYNNSGKSSESFINAIDVRVFQNGYELDGKVSLTTEAEDKAFNEVKQGASIVAAEGFKLNDTNVLTVVLTAYDKDYNQIIERTELTIPDNIAKDITGNKSFFEKTGEVPINNGISLVERTGEVSLTGYKWGEFEGEERLLLYFDYTNLLDGEKAMSESDFDITVFQNGIEQDSCSVLATTAEEHFFSEIQKDTTIHFAVAYTLKDKSDIEVRLSAYTDSGESSQEQVVSIK